MKIEQPPPKGTKKHRKQQQQNKTKKKIERTSPSLEYNGPSNAFPVETKRGAKGLKERKRERKKKKEHRKREAERERERERQENMISDTSVVLLTARKLN